MTTYYGRNRTSPLVRQEALPAPPADPSAWPAGRRDRTRRAVLPPTGRDRRGLGPDRPAPA